MRQIHHLVMLLVSASYLMMLGSSAPSEATTSTTERFLSWAKENEILNEDLLEIKWFDGVIDKSRYRGLVVKRDVEMGDRLLSVPRSVLMTSNRDERNNAIEHALSKIKTSLPKRIVLGMKLLYHVVTETEFWSPYLDFLTEDRRQDLMTGRYAPSDRDTSLLYFSESELKELQCPTYAHCPVLEKVRKAKLELKSVWDTVEPVLKPHFPKNTLTYESFMWSFITVSSRAFSINVTASHGLSLLGEGQGRSESVLGGLGTGADAVVSYVLAPFAGLFNHHNSVPALQFSYSFNDETKSLEVFADQDYKKGDQVYISYGILTNPELLLNYGFVMPDNVYETAGLGFELENNDDETAKLLKRYDLHTKTHVSLTGNPSPEFIAAMRIKMRDSKKKHDKNEENINPYRPIDANSEFEVYQSLLLNVEQLLQMYPTSLKDDLEMLRQQPTSRVAQAIVLRVEVKRILHATILQCLRGIERSFRLLEDTTRDEDKEDTKLQKMWTHWDKGMKRWNETWSEWNDAIDRVWFNENDEENAEKMTARQYIESAFGEAVRNELESLGIDSMTPTSLESLEETRQKLMMDGHHHHHDNSDHSSGSEIDEKQLKILKEHIEAMLSD